MTTEKMVIGILLSHDLKKVLLILKTHPDWQKGKYNFPGGHIENDETSQLAVIREMKEETGLEPIIWWKVRLMKGTNWDVSILTSICYSGFKPQQLTDEAPEWFDVNNLPDNIIPNIRFLTHVAIDKLLNRHTFNDMLINY